MYVTLTNNGPEPEQIGTPDGDWVDALHTAQPFDVNDEHVGVVIVGDKPDVRDQFARAAQVVGDVVRKLLSLIAGRKQHAQDAGQPELVTLMIANHGTNALRVQLGGGTNEQQVAPGASLSVTAPGYIELRELGTLDESQQDGGEQPAAA